MPRLVGRPEWQPGDTERAWKLYYASVTSGNPQPRLLRAYVAEVRREHVARSWGWVSAASPAIAVTAPPDAALIHLRRPRRVTSASIDRAMLHLPSISPVVGAAVTAGAAPLSWTSGVVFLASLVLWWWWWLTRATLNRARELDAPAGLPPARLLPGGGR